MNAMRLSINTCLICGDDSDVHHCHKTGPGELSATDTEHRTLFYGLCRECLAINGVYEDVRQRLAWQQGLDPEPQQTSEGTSIKIAGCRIS
jgi:hypothetical protein